MQDKQKIYHSLALQSSICSSTHTGIKYSTKNTKIRVSISFDQNLLLKFYLCLNIPINTFLGNTFFLGKHLARLNQHLDAVSRQIDPADDTCLIVDDKNRNDLHKKIKTEIISLNKWMIVYKLTLNLSKSTLILIHPKSRGHKTNLYLISSPFVSNLLSVSMSKYLGLIFDNKGGVLEDVLSLEDVLEDTF